MKHPVHTETHTQTDTETQTQRHRYRDTDTETATQRHRHRDTYTETNAQRHKHRHTETQVLPSSLSSPTRARRTYVGVAIMRHWPLLFSWGHLCSQRRSDGNTAHRTAGPKGCARAWVCLFYRYCTPREAGSRENPDQLWRSWHRTEQVASWSAARRAVGALRPEERYPAECLLPGCAKPAPTVRCKRRRPIQARPAPRRRHKMATMVQSYGRQVSYETLPLIYLDSLLIHFNQEKVIYFNLSTNGRRIRGFEGAQAPPEHTSAPFHRQKHPSKLDKKFIKHFAIVSYIQQKYR